ncbi:NaMN:DMB phosphoribosyltransferase [Saccharomonospora marina XMU15]|uniref:NaMN:DMB phosphoribosyltransferase n=1 Tax=Saccharomonospora marina XMU15 TaxID=882083 RepID=H5X0K6_9PSEU|nr:NaMN:DMB phosphoribosyltransferase [Saccharomonospora marina XMU15]
MPVSIDFADIGQLDEIARAEALRQRGGLGTLDEIAGWLSACQGQAPPRTPRRARVVVFAADHGIAARGVSAQPAGSTARAAAELAAGTASLALLAGAGDARLRVVDLAVDAEETPPAVDGGFKVRRGTGSIDTEDALTREEAEAAVRAGMLLADAAVDEGADLLVPAELGVAVSTPAATLVAALTGTEPVAVVGRGGAVEPIDDNTWMRKAAAVRDALRRAKTVLSDPLDLLRTSGGADLAAVAGFLARAAARRTPVLLDGLAVTAAALVAEEFAPGARSWWAAAHRGSEPAHAMALEHLDLEPIVDLGVRRGGGLAATAVLPLLTAATLTG